VKKLIEWLKKDDANPPELNESQLARFENHSWRTSNSKWSYIVWFSLGLYAGLVLIYQAARAGSAKLVRLGLIHTAGLMVFVPVVALGSSSSGIGQALVTPIGLIWGLVGVLFTVWANPTVLRAKASRLDIVSLRGTTGTNVQPPPSNPSAGDLRADGADKGPRKLDI